MQFYPNEWNQQYVRLEVFSYIDVNDRGHRLVFIQPRRRTFLYSAMRELVCTASQLQSQIARAFASNSLVNTVDMMAAIQYILTATQSLGSQVYYEKSRMTILGLAGVLFCENEQA